MQKSLGVTPPDLRAASHHLAEVSTRMKYVLSSLRENLSAEGAPWVGGKAGEQFAEGDDGFLAQLQGVDDSGFAKTDVLDYYSGGLKGAADSLQQQDEV